MNLANDGLTMVEHGHRYTEGGNTCITSLIPMSPCIQLFLLAKWVAGFFLLLPSDEKLCVGGVRLENYGGVGIRQI